MAMVVKNNMSAVRTLNTLNSNSSALQKSLQKVSSGMKINSAQDDASGYAISERMRVRIRSLDQANQNSQNDSSLMKTAEGAVGNTVEILRALKEKAINAANDSNTDEDRQTIQKEINQFIDQIDDNALVQFNGKYLVDGSKNNAFNETKSILLNQSLRTGTSSSSALTELSNRAGDSLGIQTTDQYQVSWVQNGTIHFTSGTVKDKAISDILNVKAEVTGADGKVTTETFGEVKATGENGLISGPATEKVNQFTDPMTLEVDDNDHVVTSSVANLITAFEQYLTDNGDDGNPVPINKLTTPTKDSEGNDVDVKAFGASETAGFEDGVTIKKDGTDYTIVGLDTGDKIYQLNKEYTPVAEKPEPGTYTAAELLTYAQTVDTSTLAEPFKSVGTSGVKLSTLTMPTTATANIPDGAENIRWAILDSSNKEVEGGADYYIWQNSGGSKLFISTVADDTDKAIADGHKVAILYDIPKSQEGDNGLTDAADKFGKAVYTPDKTDGVAFGATTSGVNYQISGLTVSILDQDGNVKKAANAALDQFKQYQRAENKTGDMSLNFHIGSEANVAFKVGLGDMRAQALGLKGSDGTRLDVYTKEHANAAINVIENALTKALDQQTTIGAIEARLEYTSTNLTTSSENVQAAESTIRDADMAKEMTNYTKSNVLLQAAQAMLAQANQNSSAVLSLLQ